MCQSIVAGATAGEAGQQVQQEDAADAKDRTGLQSGYGQRKDREVGDKEKLGRQLDGRSLQSVCRGSLPPSPHRMQDISLGI